MNTTARATVTLALAIVLVLALSLITSASGILPPGMPVRPEFPPGLEQNEKYPPGIGNRPVFPPGLAWADLILTNGRVYTMDPENPVAEAVAIRGGKILAVGRSQDVKRYLRPGETEVIDVGGLVISPGFIDAHTHVRRGQVAAECMVRMGVTTVISDPCGSTPYPVGEFIADVNETGFPVNIRTYVGHTTLRGLVGVPDRYTAATPAQIEEMMAMADQALEEGALGISFGLEYVPGASYEEVRDLASVAAEHGAHIACHIRFGTHIEPDTSLVAVQEMVQVARETGCSVQIAHIGSMGANLMEPCLNAIEAAREEGLDITVDCYPYTAWSTSIGSAVFDPGWQVLFNITYEDVEVASGPYAGQRLTEDLFNYLRENAPGTSLIAHAIPWEDVVMAYQKPYVMVGSDGSISSSLTGHPRGAGTHPRVLGMMVRENGILTLDEALYKMTAFPAWRMELDTKGVLKAGYDADIVVFDPDTIVDNATFGPVVCATPPTGIKYVFVNGVLAVVGTEYTGAMAGRAIPRH